jgi:hypothetical protein
MSSSLTDSIIPKSLFFILVFDLQYGTMGKAAGVVNSAGFQARGPCGNQARNRRSSTLWR